jgi:hypothetical protein
VRGGYREGAGRKTLFPGKTKRKTISLTLEAVAKANDVAAALREANPNVTVSVSDAFEAAMKAYPLRRRRKK